MLRGRFTSSLREVGQQYLSEFINHPFHEHTIHELSDVEIYLNYCAQDFFFADAYAMPLNAAAALITGQLDATFLSQRAQNAVTYMKEFATSEWAQIGRTFESGQQTSTTARYVSFLREQVVSSDVACCLASVLPCNWFYYEAGQRLKALKPTCSRHERWIRWLAFEGYEETIGRYCDILDQEMEGASSIRTSMVKSVFLQACQYDIEFLTSCVEKWA